jgi:RNA polymerase sigma-70 factor, ECF subfamily
VRSNEQWLRALRSTGAERDEAIESLRALLVRGLSCAFNDGSVADSDIEDFAQVALLKVLGALDGFRGGSRFLTWASKIAVRVAYSELRRRRWRDVSLDALLAGPSEGDRPADWPDDAAGPERVAMRRAALETLRRVIAEELTEKQRAAMMAIQLHGMPVEEVARRMGTNRNALYKLMHDARKRLKARMAQRGMDPNEMLALFEAAK